MTTYVLLNTDSCQEVKMFTWWKLYHSVPYESVVAESGAVSDIIEGCQWEDQDASHANDPASAPPGKEEGWQDTSRFEPHAGKGSW
jgi:hypothetical protein